MNINELMGLFTLPVPVWETPDDTGGGGGGDDSALGGDDTPADDVPADDTPADDTPADDTPADDTPKDDKAALDDDDALSDEDKAKAEAEEKAKEVPEDGVYDFELPEDVTLSDEDRTMWSEQFKELGLTRDQANKLVAKQAESVAQEQKAYADFLSKQQSDQLAEAQADKDIGGDKWEESKRVAKLGLKALGSDALKNLILTSGNGNNPDIIRALMRVGETVKDDKFEPGASHEAPTSTESSWYGNTTPDKKKG